MPRRPSSRVFVLTADEHRFLLDVLRNFHGDAIEDILHGARPIAGGVTIADDDLPDLLDAVGVEAMGFLKVEEENAGQPLDRPRSGGKAERLFALHDRIEAHLS